MGATLAKGGRKRKINVERYPSGEVKPIQEASPISIKRLMMAAAARMASEEWGTLLGRYFLTGQITDLEYRAGRKFGSLCESYTRIMGGPKKPSNSSPEKVKSKDIDIDSFAGEEEQKKHIIILDNYKKIEDLIGCKESFKTVRIVCEGLGELPENYAQFLMCKHCLNSLAIYWKLK